MSERCLLFPCDHTCIEVMSVDGRLIGRIDLGQHKIDWGGAVQKNLAAVSVWRPAGVAVVDLDARVVTQMITPARGGDNIRVKLSADLSILIFSTDMGNIYVLECEADRQYVPKHTIHAHSRVINCIDVNCDGTIFATVCRDENAVKLWNLGQGLHCAG